MPRGSVIEVIPAPSCEVFEFLHDYDRRLEWDTLLSDARLVDGWREAQVGAMAECTGRGIAGLISMKTVYVSFQAPVVAAVKMVNRPAMFERFAATIRHEDLSARLSSVEYVYNFVARPSWMRGVLHPILSSIFRWETRKRLRALREHFAASGARGGYASNRAFR